jgi:carboxyl-terminal processing protease
MRYPSLFLLLFLLLATPAFSAKIKDTKIPNFIRIWGFLKYYHPHVATGQMDWDESFRKGLKQIEALNSKTELNAFYISWIDQLGSVEKCDSCKIEVPATSKYNLDMKWLKDSNSFNATLIEKLQYIQKNRNQKENYYAGKSPGSRNPDFKNEKVYADSIFPSVQLRLLTLARFWNTINYFFPYRYQTSQPWDQVLAEMVPKFQYAKDTTAYHLAIMEMVAKIDDSHAQFSSPFTDEHFGMKGLSFKFKIIDNKAVVTRFFNDSLSKASDIRIGDAFLSIEGISIGKLIADNSKYIGASNPAVKLREIHSILFYGNTPTVETEFEREGTIAKKTVPRFTPQVLNYKRGADASKDTIKVLEGNIGYVNMGNLITAQVPMLISKLKGTRAIIFDVRNYPQGTLYEISKFLNNERKPFVKIIKPDLSHPGTFTDAGDLFAGGDNKDYYKGKVILLCNETSQSHAEFTLMALQTAPNVTTIGSQTAGADGNVSLITLPGGFKTYISGLGIFYPDGRETQRIGIVPVIQVRPTIKGIIEGRDEVLEKALEVLREK